MELIEQIRINLDSLKALSGVENAVLTQRDGNPITSSGVWLSKTEIFHVCAATSAIYNVGLSLHGSSLRSMVIEGPKAKIVIAPVLSGRAPSEPVIDVKTSSGEYFIALTTQASVNLGSIFIKTQSSLSTINNLLLNSGKSFAPPLREFNDREISNIVDKFKAKDEVKEDITILQVNHALGFETFKKCEEILWNLNKLIPNLIYSSASFKGGYLINSIQPSSDFLLTPDVESAMSFSLFDTASRYAWMLKKMSINSIFFDCTNYMHFILGFEGGIFSTFLFKDDQKLGYIRLLLPKFASLLQEAIEQDEAPGFFEPSTKEFVVSPLLIR
jgi:predicted regulator of Ras-like GTPase activity (Roadblock/LC7/MglB family)